MGSRCSHFRRGIKVTLVHTSVKEKYILFTAMDPYCWCTAYLQYKAKAKQYYNSLNTIHFFFFIQTPWKRILLQTKSRRFYIKPWAQREKWLKKNKRTYCVEAQGHGYKTNIDPVIKLQKKAGFCDSTHQLVYLFQSRTLKSFDTVYLKATKIMFPVQNKKPSRLYTAFGFF